MVNRNQPRPSPSSARNRLAALGEKKPRTKAAQVRNLWPEIKAALDRGHTLKAICECLEADGLKMSVYTLGSYVTRMRRRSTQPPVSGAINSVGIEVPAQERTDRNVELEESRDPLANVRKSQAKRPAFDYRPELADPDKLI